MLLPTVVLLELQQFLTYLAVSEVKARAAAIDRSERLKVSSSSLPGAGSWKRTQIMFHHFTNSAFYKSMNV